jgi:Uma2 family endonuclease
MAVATQRTPPRLSRELFRAFYATRPDEEHWELIDGIAVMMTPVTVVHQIIARNLETLLSQSLREHAPNLIALQRLGVNIAPPVEDYDPAPDVVVIDAKIGRDLNARYIDRFYLAAEIVSASDRIGSKRNVRSTSCTRPALAFSRGSKIVSRFGSTFAPTISGASRC